MEYKSKRSIFTLNSVNINIIVADHPNTRVIRVSESDLSQIKSDDVLPIDAEANHNYNYCDGNSFFSVPNVVI
jgi:hypothetical protein